MKKHSVYEIFLRRVEKGQNKSLKMENIIVPYFLYQTTEYRDAFVGYLDVFNGDKYHQFKVIIEARINGTPLITIKEQMPKDPTKSNGCFQEIYLEKDDDSNWPSILEDKPNFILSNVELDSSKFMMEHPEEIKNIKETLIKKYEKQLQRIKRYHKGLL